MTWKTSFQGTKMGILCGLIGALIIERDVAADGIAEAIADDPATLPWQGCEQRLLEVLIEQLRDRGHGDDQIGQVVGKMAAMIGEMKRRAECMAPTTFCPIETIHEE